MIDAGVRLPLHLMFEQQCTELSTAVDLIEERLGQLFWKWKKSMIRQQRNCSLSDDSSMKNCLDAPKTA